MSYLRQLVQSTLRAQKKPAGFATEELEIALFGLAAIPAARVAAYSGSGLDVANGECLLAGICTYSSDRGYEHRMVGAVTNRRTLFGGFSTAKGALNDARGSVDHEAVMGVDGKGSLVFTKCDVLTPTGPQNFAPLKGRCPDIEKFFAGLARIPFGQRADPPMPLPTPSPEDPTGAHAALASLWFPDERTHALLASVIAAVNEGALDLASAIDLVRRLQIAHRSTFSGPASYGQSFLSPLSADDLAHVLIGAFGQAMAYGNPQPGVHCLDIRIDPKRDAISPALKALGIASFIGLGIGFSPGGMIAAEMVKKPPVHAIRFVYYDVQGGCAYEMYANGKRLEQGEGEMAHAIHQLLLHSAWPVLERRCRVGWQTPYPQLFAS
jgi:hypothetical protein